MWDLIVKFPIETSSAWLSIIPVIAIAYRREFHSKPLRYASVFLVPNAIFQAWMMYKCSRGENNTFYSNAYVVLRYIFVTAIFYTSFRDSLHQKAAIALLPIFIILVAADWFALEPGRSLKYAHLSECVFGGTLCLLFFRELLHYLPVMFLSKMTMFYVASAFLIYYFGNLFLSPLPHYLHVSPYNQDMAIFITMPYILESILFIVLGIGLFVKE